MADRKIDRPSDHDFFMAFYDNLPSKKDERRLLLGVAAGYAIGKAIKHGSRSRKRK